MHTPKEKRLLFQTLEKCDLTCRFRLLDMRWKALGRAMDLSQVPAQGDAAFQSFCDAPLGVRVLRAAFSSTPFLSIDAVGSGLWTALREYTDCDTHQRFSFLLVASVGPEAW